MTKHDTSSSPVYRASKDPNRDNMDTANSSGILNPIGTIKVEFLLRFDTLPSVFH